jgi:hypothetical protein
MHISASTGASGRTNCQNGGDILVVVLVAMLAAVLMVMMSLPLVLLVGASDIRLSKRTIIRGPT